VTELIEDQTFRNVDWYGEEFTERHYLRCTFLHLDLTEATSQGTVFEECVFGNVRFNASRHTDAAFLRCAFNRCNFFEAEFTGCKVTGSQFAECDLRPLRVTGGDWSFVGLPGADLRGTTFQGVRMREDAVLTGVDLSAAQLHGARFSRADLRGSDLSALDPTVTPVDGAVINAEQAVVVAQAMGFKIG
jgi:fluoroquinolone resistance protein